MESQRKINQTTQTDDVSASELQTAKTAINTLLVAVKNACLYPEDHAVCQHSITHAFNQINNFIKDYNNFKVTVNQNQFLYEGKVIHHAPPDSSNLAFVFYGDGILWLEFQQGLNAEEIKELFQIVNHYKNPQEEAEGDLVTSLWEADFDHISYAAADINPDPDIFLDFPLFRVSNKVENGDYQLDIAAGTGMPASSEFDNQINTRQPFQAENGRNGGSGDKIRGPLIGSGIPRIAGEKSHGSGTGPQVSLGSGTDREQGTKKKPRAKSIELAVPLSQAERHLWTLTTDEEEALQQMVAEEEQSSRSGNVFDVLLNILKIQTDEADFAGILSFLQDEFKESLFQRQFPASLHLLQALRIMYAQENQYRKWIHPLIARFFITVSSPPTLQVLKQIWSDVVEHETEPQQLALARICQQLTPVANQTIIPLLAGNAQGQLPQMLEKIVQNFATRDLASLTPLLDNQDESVVLKLIEIIAAIEDQQTTKMLLKLAKHHNFQIRKEAIKTLLNREPTLLPKLIHGLDDAYDTIRLMILNHLSRERHNLAEHLLLEYLAQHKFNANEGNHLRDCYQTLGRCGSGRCIPFLKKMLLEHGWNIFGNLATSHRESAALALYLLKQEEADNVLKQAARSLNPQIRLACRKAREQKR
jgi:hypothetical protein